MTNVCIWRLGLNKRKKRISTEDVGGSRCEFDGFGEKKSQERVQYYGVDVCGRIRLRCKVGVPRL